MKVTIFIGGNKEFTASRLGVKLGEELAEQGFDVTLRAVKGKVKVKEDSVRLQEYAAIAKPKTLAAALKKDGADFVISLMNLNGCQAACEAGVPFVYAENEGFKEDKAVKDKKNDFEKSQTGVSYQNIRQAA